MGYFQNKEPLHSQLIKNQQNTSNISRCWLLMTNDKRFHNTKPYLLLIILYCINITIWLNWLGEFVEVYHVVLLLPKNCLVFWKRQPWVSLADVTLLVGVDKYLLHFWFKRVEDCYIRLSKIVKTKSGILLTFVWKEQKEIYYVKAYLWGVY